MPHCRLLPPSPNWYVSQVCDASSDSHMCAFGSRNVVWLLDLHSRLFVGELIGHTNRVNGVSLSTCLGSTLCASASADTTVRVWDATSCQCLHTNHAHTAEVLCVTLCGASSELVASGDKSGGLSICAWRQENVQRPDPIKPGGGSIQCLAAQREALAVGCQSGLVLVLSLSDQTVLARLSGHELEIQSLCWRPDVDGDDERVLASGSKDRTVRIWSLNNKKQIRYVFTPKSDGGRPAWTSVVWAPGAARGEPRLISSGPKGELFLWKFDSPKGTPKRFANGHTRMIFCAVVVGVDHLVTVSMDREIIIWDLNTLKVEWQLCTIGGFVYDLSCSIPDAHRVAVAVGDKTIRLWDTSPDVSTYEVDSLWKGLQEKVTAVAWHPAVAGMLAYGTEQGKIGVLLPDESVNRQLGSLHKGAVYSLSWDDQTLLSCAHDGIVLMSPVGESDAAEAENAAPTVNLGEQALAQHPVLASVWLKSTKLCEVAMSSDSKLIALGRTNGSVTLLRSQTLEPTGAAHDHSRFVSCLRWRDELLASASDDGSIRIYDSTQAEFTADNSSLGCTCVLNGHTAAVPCVVWNVSQPHLLASASYDGTAQVWDIRSGAGIANMRGHTGRVLAVEWSHIIPNTLISGGDDQSVRMWDTTTSTHTQPPTKRPKPSNKPKPSVKAQPPASSPPIGAPAEELHATSLFTSLGRTNPSLDDLSRQTVCLAQQLDGKQETRADLGEDCGFLLGGEALDALSEGLADGRKATCCGVQLPAHRLVSDGWVGRVSSLCANSQQLTPELVALLGGCGYDVWVAGMVALARQSEAREDIHTAVLFWLGVDQPHEAVRCYMRAQLFRDAAALAHKRLLSADPLMSELYSSWAGFHASNGAFEAAAKCLVVAGERERAIELLLKRTASASGANILAAAEIATLSGLAGAQNLWRRHALHCQAQHRWEDAKLSFQRGAIRDGDVLALCVAECFAELLRLPKAERACNKWVEVVRERWATCDITQDELRSMTLSSTPGSVNHTAMVMASAIRSSTVDPVDLSQSLVQWYEAAWICYMAGDWSAVDVLLCVIAPQEDASFGEWLAACPDCKHTVECLQGLCGLSAGYNLWWRGPAGVTHSVVNNIEQKLLQSDTAQVAWHYQLHSNRQALLQNSSVKLKSDTVVAIQADCALVEEELALMSSGSRNFPDVVEALTLLCCLYACAGETDDCMRIAKLGSLAKSSCAPPNEGDTFSTRWLLQLAAQSSLP